MNKELEKFFTDNDKVIDIQCKKSNTNISIQYQNDFFYENFYMEDMFDHSKYTKFIKNVENQIRTSDEYSNYIYYLKSEIHLNKCAILGNIDDEMTDIEFHHYPFTLYDIVNVVTAKKILNKEKVSTFIIIDKVLKLHYENKIGLVPLCKTIHQLAHAGEIFINLNQVFGKVNDFINDYYLGLTDELVLDYNQIVKLSKQNIKYNKDDILAKSKKMNYNLTNNETKLNNE